MIDLTGQLVIKSQVKATQQFGKVFNKDRTIEVRQRNHLSQAMLSELVDKTPSYISYIESGIKSMSLDTFVLIANALGVSPDRLLMEQIISTERCASEEIALLLSDCSTYEMMILLDVIKSLKASLKEHQGRYGKPDNFDFTV